MRSLGDIYFIKGDIQQALESYEEGVNQCEKNGLKQKSILEARLGKVFLETGEKARALEKFEDSLNKEILEGDRQRLANLVYHLGRYHLHEENYARAHEYSQQGLKLIEDIDDGSSFTEEKVLNHLNLGNVYADEGKIDETIDEIKKAKESITNRNNWRKRILLGEVHRFLGEFYRQKGEYKEAEEHLSIAIEIFEDQGDRRNHAKTRYHLSILDKDNDNLDKAKDGLQHTLSEFKDMQMEDWKKSVKEFWRNFKFYILVIFSSSSRSTMSSSPSSSDSSISSSSNSSSISSSTSKTTPQ